MAPVHLELGRLHSELRPFPLQAWFWWVQGVLVCLGAGGLALYYRRLRLLADPEYLGRIRARREVAQALTQAGEAMAAADTRLFFAAARRAAQALLGEVWGMAPEGITLAEVRSRLGDGAPGLARIWQLADAVAYSGLTVSSEDLRENYALLQAELERIGRRSVEETRR